MKIYFVTTNRGKVESVSSALGEYGIKVIHIRREIEEKRSENLEEVTADKVMKAYEISGRKPTIAIDSGFFVPSLNGFPGTFTNYALKTIGIEGILKLVENRDRKCYFEQCLGYMDSELQEPVVFSSKVDGVISEKPQGEMRKWSWSSLHLIFKPRIGKEICEKTLAQMEREEWERIKASIYSRENCYEKFVNWLKENRGF